LCRDQRYNPATAILVSTSVPDLRNTVPVARKSIDAPIQKNHTDNIGNVPVIMPFVNDPKYSAVPWCHGM
jgi:hypothetical protein